MINGPTANWIETAVFYHIYPLGLCGAPLENNFTAQAVNRMEALHQWIPHIKALGCNAVYLGPVFESDFHGYDTADYFTVDRRLGTNATLTALSRSLHNNGIKLVLDTVFNHVGRNFWAFKDVQQNGRQSAYVHWFSGVDFNRKSTYGDDFYYEGWFDAYNLVKLNLDNPEVKQYLFSVVDFWLREFAIDGLRLDVAEIMQKHFLAELSSFCRSRKPNIWLMGEVINGNYNDWANNTMLDSTTNYEAYKALYSSHNDRNYYEIAHTLNRQFGANGLYNTLLLYNFADNHDTTRIASILHNKNHLVPVYTLMFTLPGIPSVYYGSEWGIEGIKGAHEDTQLRPAIVEVPQHEASPLSLYIERLAWLKQHRLALQQGCYREMFVTAEQLVFSREVAGQMLLVALNMSGVPVSVTLLMNHTTASAFRDELEPAYEIIRQEHLLVIDNIPAFGARILTEIP